MGTGKMGKRQVSKLRRFLSAKFILQLSVNEKAHSFTTDVIEPLIAKPAPYGRLSPTLRKRLKNEILPDPEACMLVLQAFAIIRRGRVKIEKQRRQRNLDALPVKWSDERTFWPENCSPEEKQLISVVEVSDTITDRTLGKQHNYSEDQILGLHLHKTDLTVQEILPILRRSTKGKIPSKELAAFLEKTKKTRTGYHIYCEPANDRRVRIEIQKLIDASESRDCYPLTAVDAWTEALYEILQSPKNAAALTPLLRHAETASAAMPSAQWLAAAQPIVSALDSQLHIETVATALAAVGRSAQVKIIAPVGGLGTPPQDAAQKMVTPRYSDLLRGLVWSLQLSGDSSLAVCLAETTERCFKKLRLYGPVSAKIGNACIHALAAQANIDALGQLVNLKSRIKNRTGLNLLDKVLSELAKTLNLSEEDLDDIAVPTLGLQQVGRGQIAIGEYIAVLKLAGNNTIEQSWIGPSGKVHKSVPTQVKTEYADELKTFKKKIKSIKALVSSQRRRIECMLGTNRSVRLAAWQTRYLRHPVVGHISRGVIWRLRSGDTTTLALQSDDDLIDLSGKKHSPADGATFTLWHPIESDAKTVSLWRRFIETRQITQPFRQAHREVYKLTQAERTAQNHTPRFSGIVVVQRIYKALCGTRGWHHDLWGRFDGAELPFLIIKHENLWVELDLESSFDTEPDVQRGEPLRYLELGSLRFFRLPAKHKGWL
ncbi:MAG: DUF4132 domain-containing protein, partial [Kofleriaceae bacterium]|nr:DUF4132 domain-containing protein [Kofleriaceae bacterium]